MPYYLYSNLRCGLLHVLTPQSTIALTELKNSDVENGIVKHLGFHTFNNENHKRLILVAETLYNDLEIAAIKLISMLNDGSIFRSFPELNDAPQRKKDKISLNSDALNINLEARKDGA